MGRGEDHGEWLAEEGLRDGEEARKGEVGAERSEWEVEDEMEGEAPPRGMEEGTDPVGRVEEKPGVGVTTREEAPRRKEEDRLREERDPGVVEPWLGRGGTGFEVGWRSS